jgi:hypothetical protein
MPRLSTINKEQRNEIEVTEAAPSYHQHLGPYHQGNVPSLYKKGVGEQ